MKRRRGYEERRDEENEWDITDHALTAILDAEDRIPPLPIVVPQAPVTLAGRSCLRRSTRRLSINDENEESYREQRARRNVGTRLKNDELCDLGEIHRPGEHCPQISADECADYLTPRLAPFKQSDNTPMTKRSRNHQSPDVPDVDFRLDDSDSVSIEQISFRQPEVSDDVRIMVQPFLGCTGNVREINIETCIVYVIVRRGLVQLQLADLLLVK